MASNPGADLPSSHSCQPHHRLLPTVSADGGGGYMRMGGVQMVGANGVVVVDGGE